MRRFLGSARLSPLRRAGFSPLPAGRGFKFALRTIALVLAYSATVGASPPTLTQLYPAGGQRGQTVQVAATGTFTPWPVQGWCDSPHIKVMPAKEPGKLSVAIAADAVPGTYWVRVFNKEDASESRPFLVGNLPEVLETEPNDEFKKPHVLASSSVVNGKLEKPGDVDCFAIKATKGQTLVASLDAQVTLKSPMDGVLQILSEDGFVLDQNNDYHEMDPRIAFRVPRDGTYVVRAFAFPSKPDTAIRFAGGDKFLYRLTVTTGGFADHAFPLAVDKDIQPIALFGWNIPASAKQVKPVATADTSAIAFHPEVANAAFVRFEPHATVVKEDNPKPLILPTTISGILEKPGAAHSHPFDAKKGQKLVFQIESRTLGFPLDPVLRLTDAQGKQLAAPKTTPLNMDPTLSYTVPADGSYRIEVRDFHDDGGPRFVYRLRAVFAEPDFVVTSAADRISLVPGKPFDFAVAIDRRNGFSQDLELHLEGPPEGTVKVVQSKAAAAAKTTTLKLTAAKDAFSGPIRIVARAKTGLARAVRGAGAEPGWSSEHIWLTIGSGKK